MKYMLMVLADEQAFQALDQATAAKMVAPYAAYTEALKEAGIMKGAERLRPTASATTVRVSDGKTQVLNGPYAETKEQLGGYFLIDVPDLDAAISWAARCPASVHGTVEIRPLWIPQQGEYKPG